MAVSSRIVHRNRTWSPIPGEATVAVSGSVAVWQHSSRQPMPRRHTRMKTSPKTAVAVHHDKSTRRIIVRWHQGIALYDFFRPCRRPPENLLVFPAAAAFARCTETNSGRGFAASSRQCAARCRKAKPRQPAVGRYATGFGKLHPRTHNLSRAGILPCGSNGSR